MNLPTTLDSNFVQLGFLGKPFALKGECTFYPFHKESSALNPGTKLYLKTSLNKILKLTLLNLKWNNEVGILQFEGISDVEKAKELTKAEVFLARNQLPPLKDDEFYLHDIVGFEVHDLESQKIIGLVKSFSFNSAQQTILNILTHDEKTLEVLLHPFMKSVDLKLRRCYIDQPRYE